MIFIHVNGLWDCSSLYFPYWRLNIIERSSLQMTVEAGVINIKNGSRKIEDWKPWSWMNKIILEGDEENEGKKPKARPWALWHKEERVKATGEERFGGKGGGEQERVHPRNLEKGCRAGAVANWAMWCFGSTDIRGLLHFSHVKTD